MLERIERAAENFRRAYKQEPHIILMNSKTLAGLSPADLSQIPHQVRVYRNIADGDVIAYREEG
jgi:hypothetical protein